MEKLLSLLKSMPEYSALMDSVSHGESAAITGIGQMNRSHMIAALRADTSAPSGSSGSMSYGKAVTGKSLCAQRSINAHTE